MTSSTLPSSSTNPQQPWTYDVFLSFRGRDTRNTFTSHLYSALNRRGIKVYRDDKELARGDSIEPSLLSAIEASRFSIVVLSKNYASSAWCLEELSKIVECRKACRHTVFPVFFDVDPGDGAYRKSAICQHEKDGCSAEQVRRWEEALKEVMENISGEVVMNKDESEIVSGIVENLWNHLTHSSSSSIIKDSTHLVGMDSRINQVMKLLAADKDSDDTNVRLIGISGMGGIGKTTLARVLHHTLLAQHSSKFHGQSCFLYNVRERFEKHGPTHLQEHLLSDILMDKNTIPIRDPEKGRILIKQCLQNKKVLIFLDDVDDPLQLEMLAVNRDSFGPGSRIVVTSRDKELVTKYASSSSSYWEAGECGVYSIEKLGEDESLRLFSWKAFKSNDPAKGFEEMCKCVLEYCQGLPLAIEVLGCLLNGKSKGQWESQIDLLKGEDYNYSIDGIMNVLKISYDGLRDDQKKIFLDIACFFKGKDVSDGSRILSSFRLSVESGFEALVAKSLLTTCYGKLEMHDLLQEMGREIVRRESPNDQGKRSRMWRPDEVFDVLETATVTEEVEAIVLDLPSKDAKILRSCNVKAFEKMYRLRLLIVRNVEFDQGPEYLPSGLSFLEWDGYPSDSLPSSFTPSKLVELNMCNSNIEQLCRGRNTKNFTKLKVMNLSHSHKLTETPDFIAIPNVERLAFEDCTSLTEIHPSIVHLEKLVHLNFSGCTNIKNFPHTIGRKKMTSLQELLLDKTNIQELPESIKLFTGLSKLSLKDCKSLMIVPKGISKLKSLKVFNLSGCSQLDNVPEIMGELESLEELDVSGTAIRNPPFSIFSLGKLKILSFQGCNNGLSNLKLPAVFGFPFIRIMNLANCGLGERDIPSELGKLPSLYSLDLSGNRFVSLPDITELSRLHELHLEDCKMLKFLPELPSEINYVVVNRCSSLEKLPNPVKLCSNLFFLEGFDCPKLQNGKKDAGFSMFLRYLRGWWDTPLPRERSGIVVPGRTIPMWFNCPSEGTSVKIRIPSRYRKTNFDDPDSHHDIMGLAFCIALKVMTDPRDNQGTDHAVHRQDSPGDEEPHDEEMEGYSSEESVDMDDDTDEEMEGYSSEESVDMDDDTDEEVYNQDSSSATLENDDYSYDSYDEDDDDEEMENYSSDYDNNDCPDGDGQDNSFSRKRDYSKYSTYVEVVADTGNPSIGPRPNSFSEEECGGGEEGEHLWYFFVPYYNFTEYMKGQSHLYVELEGCPELKVIKTGCRLVLNGEIEDEAESSSDDDGGGEYCCGDGDDEKDCYKRTSPYNICYYEDKMMLIGMYFFYSTNSSSLSSISSRNDRTSLGIYIYRP